MSANFQKVKNGLYFPGLSADPSSPTKGFLYFNNVSNKFRQYDGSTWSDVGSGSGTSNPLVRGGAWSWNSTTGKLEQSADAFVMIAGLQEARNTIPRLGSSTNIFSKGIGTTISFANPGTTAWGQPLTVATTTRFDSVQNWLSKTGTPTGSYRQKIVRSVNGQPSTLAADIIYDSGNISIAGLPGSQTGVTHNLSPAPVLAPGSYWVVCETQSDYNSGSGNMLFGIEGGGATGSALVNGVWTSQGSGSTGNWFGSVANVITLSSDDQCAYVTPNITAGANANLAVSVADVASVPATAQIIARRLGAYVLLGQDTLIADGETKVMGQYGWRNGDLTGVEARLQNRFQVSSWRALTANVIKTDQATKVALTTGTLEDNDYLLNSGQVLISNQNLDAEFLSQFVMPLSAEVQVMYDLSAVDANPTVQLSRDGGATLQTVTVTRSSGDDSWKGNIVFSDLEPNVAVDTYPVANADSTSSFGSTTQTTTQQAQAQSFILANAAAIKQVTLYLNKLGSPSGNFTVSIVKNASGNPSTSRGDYYSTSAPQSITALSSGDNAVAITLPSTVVLPAGTYWLVIETDSAYKSSYVSGVTALRARIDASSPTAPGQFSAFNGTTWSVNATVDNVYLISGFLLDLRLKITSGTAGSKMRGYGVFYDKGVDQTVGKANRYEVSFDGSTNPTSFDLTNGGFLPDPKLLMVFWVNTGQVLLSPVFDVNGYTVTFASNQFLSSGTQRVVFWQPLGSSFDNNEKNAALLAANFLGSTDTNIDRSSAGRGIFLRRPDGTLRELTIDNSDNVAIYSV